MAGRPVASRGGLTGAHYGMITFAILTVIALGLFIFTLTRVKGAEAETASLRDKERRYGSPPAYYMDEARARNSNVFAVLDGDRRRLSELVTGVPDDVGVTVVAKADNLMAAINEAKPGIFSEGDTLLVALEKLNQSRVAAESQATSLAAEVDSLTTRNQALTTQLDETRTQFESQVASIQEQMRQVRESAERSLAEKDLQLRELQRELDDREQEVQQANRGQLETEREAEIETLRLNREIQELQDQIASVKQGGFDPDEILTKADGRILRAIPGSDVLYISLGADDGIKVGLGFEVYGQSGGISDDLRGKASVQVVTVMPDTSECRVVRRTPGQPIIEGDVVVNIAYERDRKPKFVVRGDFDLDYDGTPDASGYDQVVGMIRRWGGQVVDELDDSTDYVVIGSEPEIPRTDRAQPVSDVVRDLARQREAQLQEYHMLIERAERMYIPVIRQSQFLFLMGQVIDQ